MLKKLIALLLIITTLTSMLPVAALAGPHTDYVTQVRQMAYIRSLSGMEDSAAPFRAGQTLDANMNGRQVEECLDQLLTGTLSLALDHMEDLTIFGEQNRYTDESYDSFQDLLSETRHVRQEVKTTLDIVAYDREFIYNALIDLTDGETYVTEHERESIAYRIIRATDELKDKITYAADHYQYWLDVSTRVNALMSTGNPDIDARDADPLKANITAMKSARMQDLLRLNPAAPASDDEIVVNIVDIDHLGIFVGDINKKPLPNATVRCWAKDKPHGDSLPLNDQGFVLLPIIDYGANADRMLNVGLEVSCPGYRTQFIESTVCEGGKSFYVLLEQNHPDEDVYVAGISFNSYDILYDHRTMYITEMNDADQKLQVFLYSQQGGPFSGQLDLNYIDQQNQQHTISAAYSSDDPSPVFVSKLCQQMLPGVNNALSLSSPSGSKSLAKPELVTTQLAAVQATTYTPDSTMARELLMLGSSFGFPDSVPLLNKLHVDVTPPWPNFISYVDISGVMILGYGSRKLGLPKLLDHATNWKTSDQRALEIDAKFIAEHTGQTLEEAQKGIKKADAEDHASRFFGETKAYWGLAAYFSANLLKDVSSNNWGETIMAMVVLGFKGSWERTFYPGGIPIVLGFGFDLSATGIVKIHKPYEKVSIVPDSSSFMPSSDFDFTIQIALILDLSVGTGFKVGKVEVGVGLRAKANLAFVIPVMHNPPMLIGDKKFNFTITLSVYFKFLIVSMIYDMWSGKISYDFTTKKWSDWENTPFWKTTHASAAESLSALKSAANVTPLGADGGSETHVNNQDELSGDTPWSYTRITDIGTQSEPYCFSFASRSGDSDKYDSVLDYMFWYEDSGVVHYRSLSENFTYTVDLPEEIAKHLTAGDWRITDVTAYAGPRVYDIEVWEGMTRTHTQVQVVAVSVTIGRDFAPDAEGKFRPSRSVVVTRLYRSGISYWRDLKVRLEDGSLVPGIFVQYSDHELSGAITMPCLIELAEDRSAGYISSEIVAEDRKSMLATICYDETDNQMTGFYDKGVYPKGSADPVKLDKLDIDGHPVKLIPCNDGYYGSVMVLSDTGEVTAFSAYRLIDAPIMDDEKVTDVVLIETNHEVNGWTDYSMVYTVDNGDEQPKVMIKRLHGDNMDLVTVDDTVFEIDTHGSHLYGGTLMGEPYIYWFESRGEEAKDTVLVKGMLYDPEHNLITSPYILGVLTGDDGSAPEGYDYTSLPVSAHALLGGKMVINKAWIKNHDGGGDQQYHDPSAYSTYVVDVKRNVRPVIVGAAAEYPIVSAGADCNFDFSVLNRGNMPIFGYDIDVYVQNNGGARLLCGEVHVDLSKPDQCSVTIYKKPGDLTAGKDVFTGEAAWRRMPGLFDMINGDEWHMITNSKERKLFTVPVMMPEALQTYTMCFHVPYEWSGTATVSFEIVETYFPQYARSLFLTSRELNEILPDTLNQQQQSIVFSVRKPSSMLSSAPSESMVSAAGTLNNFSAGMDQSSLGAVPSDYSVLYTPVDRDCDFTVTDLSLDYRLFRLSDEDYITLTIQREGIHDASASRQATIIAWINDETLPCYRATVSTPFADFHKAYNITIPLRKLTGGQDADVLRFAVMDTASQGQYELTTQGNSHIVYINRALKVTVQPASPTVLEGSFITLSAAASGGSAPYTYQWQRFVDLQWQDISAGPELTLDPVTLDMDGALYRCVVTDSKGNHVRSDTVQLTVVPLEPVPVTGDPTNPLLLVFIMLTSALALIVLCKRRRL